MNLKEELYILKRRIQALDNTIILLLCRVFPIKKNKIVFVTFEGKGAFCCNPKYIARELHKRNPEYEMIWLVEDMSKEFPDYIKKASYSKWSRNYHLATAKVWVNNYRNPLGTIKRKGQYYFQTWHASLGFKKIGLFRGEAFSKMAYMVSKNDSNMIDCICIDSDWWREIVPKGLLYRGEMLDSGLPRNDDLILRKDEVRLELRDRYNLSHDIKIVLYAPTYRESSENGKRSIYSNEFNIDFGSLTNNLSKRFGGKWVVMVRLHPQLAAKMISDRVGGIPDSVIDVSKDDDMYAILPGVDFYITDYSSAIFEAMLGRIPSIIYATDYKKYFCDRGGLFFGINEGSYNTLQYDQKITHGVNIEVPLRVAFNNSELEHYVLDFDYDAYVKLCEKIDIDIHSISNGDASKKVVDWIESRIAI